MNMPKNAFKLHVLSARDWRTAYAAAAAAAVGVRKITGCDWFKMATLRLKVTNDKLTE